MEVWAFHKTIEVLPEIQKYTLLLYGRRQFGLLLLIVDANAVISSASIFSMVVPTPNTEKSRSIDK